MFSILVVDDEPDNFDVIEAFLCHQDYQLHYVSNAKDAIAALPILQPSLILLDVMMPEMDGIEACQTIKAMPALASVPIIMVTALTRKQDLAQCLAAGADDFISKPVNRLELVARVQSMLRLHQQHRQLETFNARLAVAVTQQTAQLRTMIFQDTLTQLPSRVALIDHLTTALERMPRSLALIYLDCDNFKLVNGSFGHAVGNQLLVAIAQRLQRLLASGDVLARFWGDEFCFVLHAIESEYALQPFLKTLLRCFEEPFPVETYELFVTASMGIVLSATTVSSVALSPEQLIQDADTAMYQAKQQGSNSYRFFDQHMQQAVSQRLMLENDLQRALNQNEFVLHYQPIVDLQSGAIVGVEALIRWHHPTRGLLHPKDFIASIEATGLIIPVGLWAFTQACAQLNTWHQNGWPHLTMSINLSPRQFSSPSLLSDIDQVLKVTGVDPSRVRLEITETAIMDNAEMAIALTRALRSRHIQISIDDFGTGYSSLNYLHRFPVSTLKIDQSFIRQIEVEPGNKHVVSTIITLGQHLNLSIIAEGIETPVQNQWLQQLGCDLGQGHLFSPALIPEDIERRYFAVPSPLN